MAWLLVHSGIMSATSSFQYDLMIEQALRGVVRRALTQVAKSGLPGDHHFYISFATKADGVVLPEHLRQRFPDEMTIVLQYQFWDLKVQTDGFGITLSFSDKLEKLFIPFAAITSFADPSSRFGLQFQQATDAVGDEEEDTDAPGRPGLSAVGSEPTRLDPSKATPKREPAEPVKVDADSVGDDAAKAPAGEKVVTLDAFRRK